MTVDMSLTAMPGAARRGAVRAEDITELKRAEEIRIRANALEAENRQLLEAARVKGVFLANMSHELYTPLNAIIGFAHLLGTGAIAARLAALRQVPGRHRRQRPAAAGAGAVGAGLHRRRVGPLRAAPAARGPARARSRT